MPIAFAGVISATVNTISFFAMVPVSSITLALPTDILSPCSTLVPSVSVIVNEVLKPASVSSPAVKVAAAPKLLPEILKSSMARDVLTALLKVTVMVSPAV